MPAPTIPREKRQRAAKSKASSKQHFGNTPERAFALLRLPDELVGRVLSYSNRWVGANVLRRVSPALNRIVRSGDCRLSSVLILVVSDRNLLLFISATGGPSARRAELTPMPWTAATRLDPDAPGAKVGRVPKAPADASHETMWPTCVLVTPWHLDVSQYKIGGIVRFRVRADGQLGYERTFRHPALCHPEGLAAPAGRRHQLFVASCGGFVSVIDTATGVCFRSVIVRELRAPLSPGALAAPAAPGRHLALWNMCCYDDALYISAHADDDLFAEYVTPTLLGHAGSLSPSSQLNNTGVVIKLPIELLLGAADELLREEEPGGGLAMYSVVAHGLNKPSGIVVVGAKLLVTSFVSATGQRAVQRFDTRTGVYLGRVTSPAPHDVTGFRSPWGLAVAAGETDIWTCGHGETPLARYDAITGADRGVDLIGAWVKGSKNPHANVVAVI